MLRGDANKARTSIRSLAAGALKGAWAGETPVNWDSPLYATACEIITQHANVIGDLVLVKPLANGVDGALVQYIAGKIPNSEVRSMLIAGKNCIDELYPNSSMSKSKIRLRKFREFKSNFEPALKALVMRWNDESEAYYPNGRPRNKTVDGRPGPG